MLSRFYDELNLKSGGRLVEIRGPIEAWQDEARMLCVDVTLSQLGVPSTPGEAEAFPPDREWRAEVMHPNGRYLRGVATVTALYELELENGATREWTWSQRVELK